MVMGREPQTSKVPGFCTNGRKSGLRATRAHIQAVIREDTWLAALMPTYMSWGSTGPKNNMPKTRNNNAKPPRAQQEGSHK